MNSIISQFLSLQSFGYEITAPASSDAIPYFIKLRERLIINTAPVEPEAFRRALADLTINYNPRLGDLGGFTLIITASKNLKVINSPQEEPTIAAMRRILNLALATKATYKLSLQSISLDTTQEYPPVISELNAVISNVLIPPNPTFNTPIPSDAIFRASPFPLLELIASKFDSESETIISKNDKKRKATDDFALSNENSLSDHLVLPHVPIITTKTVLFDSESDLTEIGSDEEMKVHPLPPALTPSLSSKLNTSLYPSPTRYSTTNLKESLSTMKPPSPNSFFRRSIFRNFDPTVKNDVIDTITEAHEISSRLEEETIIAVAKSVRFDDVIIPESESDPDGEEEGSIDGMAL